MSREEKAAKARSYYQAHKAEINAKRRAKYTPKPRRGRLVPVLTPRPRRTFFKGRRGLRSIENKIERTGPRRKFNPFAPHRTKESRAHAARYF